MTKSRRLQAWGAVALSAALTAACTTAQTVPLAGAAERWAAFGSPSREVRLPAPPSQDVEVIRTGRVPETPAPGAREVGT